MQLFGDYLLIIKMLDFPVQRTYNLEVTLKR